MSKLTGKKLTLVFGVFLLITLMFTTCQDPVGLGTLVNTEKPSIGTSGDDSAPGTFLQGHRCTDDCPDPCELEGKNRIMLEVEQPFGLEEVFMTVTYRYRTVDGLLRSNTENFPATRDEVTGLWYADLPTSEWLDGTIRATVTAIDVSGNMVTTTDMIYTIKNSPPQIELSIPRISGAQFDSATLNGEDEVDSRQVLNIDSIMGLASDLRGIQTGYPKIMIWPAEDNNEYGVVTIDPITRLPVDANGAALDQKWGFWHTVVDAGWNPLNMDPDDNLDAFSFRWPLRELDGAKQLNDLVEPLPLRVGYYNVMLKIKDTMDNPNENTYPNRVENINREDHHVYMRLSVTSSTNPIINIRNAPEFYNPDDPFEAQLLIQRGDSLAFYYAAFANTENYNAIDKSLDDKFITPPTQEQIDAEQFLWNIKIPSADVKRMLGSALTGQKHLVVLATDGTEDGDVTTSIRVTFDAEAPRMSFIQPVGLRGETAPTVTSRVTIRGSALDNTIVNKMWYALGETEIKNIESIGTETDRWNHDGWIDTQLDAQCETACIVPCGIPSHKPRENHPNTGLFGWFHVPAKWDEGGILPSWMWEFDDIYFFTEGTSPPTPIPGTDEYTEPVENYYVTHHDANLWSLPIWFKIQDKAGNVAVVERTLILDPDGDLPVTEISAPRDEAIVGGAVRIQGLAQDNEWVHSMEIRISKRDNDGSFQSWEIGPNFARINSPQAPNGNFGEPSQALSWHYNLNLNDELIAGLIPGSGQRQRVLVEVRARDSYLSTPEDMKPLAGLPAQLTLWFDPDVPVIENIQIIHGKYSERETALIEPYNPGMNKVSGFITLKARVRDNSDLESIRVRIGGVWGPELIGVAPPLLEPVNPFILHYSGSGGVNMQYDLFIPIDTNTIQGNAFSWQHPGSPNNFALDIEAINTTEQKFRTQTTVTMQIDNFYPFANMEGLLTAQGMWEIRGRAWDAAIGADGINRGRVGGIERVVVYFAQDNGANQGLGTPVLLDADTHGNVVPGGAAFQPSTFLARQGRTATPPDGNGISTITSEGNGQNPAPILFPAGLVNNGVWSGNTAAIVIDESSAVITATNTGFGGGTIKNWSVRFNSERLPDGKYILHYVVFDEAGNATHYHVPVYVANNRPRITRIDLGTDTNAAGSANDVLEYRGPDNIIGYSQMNPYFRVQNTLFRMTIIADEDSGNRPGGTDLRYRVHYANRAGGRAAALVAGQVYEIFEPGNIEWFNYGAPEYHVNRDNYKGIVFVASKALDLPAGGGTDVRLFTPLSAALREGEFTNDSTSPFIFFSGGSVFNTAVGTNAALINDSDNVDIDIDGRLEWEGDRFFIVHVFDATVGTYPVTGANLPDLQREHRADQLSHVALINIGVTNRDGLAPKIEVAPIGQRYELRQSLTDDPTLRNYLDRVAIALPLTVDGYNENVVTALNRGLINDNTRLGYVQYTEHNNNAALRGDSNIGRPDISGMVIFKGKAMDNNRIYRITAQIPGYDGGTGVNTEFNIAVWRNNRLEAANAASPGTPIAANLDTIANMRTGEAPWGFRITEVSTSGEYGNVINWDFAWDSSSHADLVINGHAGITFRAYDAVNSNGQRGEALTGTFNIVPYISEIVTDLSGAIRANPSTFNRSALGWYPVRENETINIRGFNLGRATAGFYPAVNISGTDVLNSAAASIYSRNATISKDVITVAVNNHETANINNITSGPLVLTVGGIATLNNRSHATAHYNQEPNDLNNDKLDNRRNLYVWHTGMIVNDSIITSPFMRVESSGRRHMVFGRYFNNAPDTRQGQLMVMVNNSIGVATDDMLANTGILTSLLGTIEDTNNRYINCTIAFDSLGNWYAASSNITAIASTGFSFYRVGVTGAHTTNGTNKRRLMRHDGDLNRFRFPRISTQRGPGTTLEVANPTRIFMSHYVNTGNNRPVLFYYGYVNGDNAFGGSLSAHNDSATPSTTRMQVVANDSQSKARGGLYSAAGGLSNGLPVVTWYDSYNQCLWISHGNQIPSAWGTANLGSATGTNDRIGYVDTSTATWQANAVAVQDLAGTHVDMVIDGNNIHLAYYDVINGGLWYAFIPPKTVTTGISQLNGNATPTANVTTQVPDLDKIQNVKVDTYLSAGTKIMLNVRAGVPYITYFHASFAETRNSIRVAWPRFTVADGGIKAGTDAVDKFTGDWEVMTVPTQTTPLTDEFIVNGVPTGNAEGRAPGWIAPSTLITSTTETNGVNPRDNALRGFSTATGATAYSDDINRMGQTILVGYMTTNWYEGAVLKYNIVGSLP
jgi:hypothetical protein